MEILVGSYVGPRSHYRWAKGKGTLLCSPVYIALHNRLRTRLLRRALALHGYAPTEYYFIAFPVPITRKQSLCQHAIVFRHTETFWLNPALRAYNII